MIRNSAAKKLPDASCMQTKPMFPSQPRCRFLLFLGILMPMLYLQAATVTWHGGIANGFWTTATNWAGNVAPVPGDDLVFPSPPFIGRLTSTNDYPSNTTFSAITFFGSNY